MRTPRGRGAGPRGVLVISIVVMLTALLAAPAMGSHHFPNEGTAEKPKPAKILVISPDDHVMLVGDSRVLNVMLCNEDGSSCKAARKAKASVKPKKGLQLSGKKGSQVKVTGSTPGRYELSFKQGGATGATTLTVNEPPVLEPTGPSGDEYRVYVSPPEATLEEGQSAMFTVWGCLLGENGRLGANELPDGVDDECIELEIIDLVYDRDAASIVGPQGSHFVISMNRFPEDATEDRTFVGTQVVTESGSMLASIIKTRATQLDESLVSGELLGDTNDNGVWDEDDWAELWFTMYGDRYDPRFDVDENGVLDAVDWDALTQGAPGMPTPRPS